MAAPMPTYSVVVAHPSALLGDLIADPLLRHHLLSAAVAVDAGGGQHTAATLQALSLMLDVLDTAPSASPSPSSLSAAELTAEFYWPKATTTTTKVKLNLPVIDEMKYQEELVRKMTEMDMELLMKLSTSQRPRGRNYKDLKKDEVKLVRKMTEMEMELQAVKKKNEEISQ